MMESQHTSLPAGPLEVAIVEGGGSQGTTDVHVLTAPSLEISSVSDISINHMPEQKIDVTSFPEVALTVDRMSIESVPAITVAELPTQHVNIQSLPETIGITGTTSIDQMPNLTVAQMPRQEIDVKSLPELGLSIGDVAVTTVPDITISQIPEVSIASMPDIVVQTLPELDVTVKSLPTMSLSMDECTVTSLPIVRTEEVSTLSPDVTIDDMWNHHRATYSTDVPESVGRFTSRYSYTHIMKRAREIGDAYVKRCSKGAAGYSGEWDFYMSFFAPLWHIQPSFPFVFEDFTLAISWTTSHSIQFPVVRVGDGSYPIDNYAYYFFPFGVLYDADTQKYARLMGWGWTPTRPTEPSPDWISEWRNVMDYLRKENDVYPYFYFDVSSSADFSSSERWYGSWTPVPMRNLGEKHVETAWITCSCKKE